MAKKRVPSYFEPWRAEPSSDWRKVWGEEPPPVDDPEVIERWSSARGKAEKNAEWIVWGSGMFEPGVAWGYQDGEPKVVNGDHIILRVGKVHTDRPGSQDHGALTKRIAECVNACRGLADPAALFDATRTLLHDMVSGDTNSDDPRVVAMLARLIPQTEEPACSSSDY